MKSSTKRVIKGKVHEVKGKIKQKVGRLTNNPRLKAEGLGEEIGGKIQQKFGKVQKVFEKP